MSFLLIKSFNRRWRLLGASFGSIICLGLLPPRVSAQVFMPEHIVLNWGGSPAGCQNITWRTSSPAGRQVAEVALATAVPYDTTGLTEVATEAQPVTALDGGTYTYYTAYVKNLEPNTLYRYRVGSAQHGFSAWYQFTTAPA